MVAIVANFGCAKTPPPEPPPGSVAASIGPAPTNQGPTFTMENAPQGGPSTSSASGPTHPATNADCDAITDRVFNLKAAEQGLADDTSMRDARADLKKRLGDAMTSMCVGKPISDETMTCVRTAASADAVAACVGGM